MTHNTVCVCVLCLWHFVWHVINNAIKLCLIYVFFLSKHMYNVLTIFYIVTNDVPAKVKQKTFLKGGG